MNQNDRIIKGLIELWNDEHYLEGFSSSQKRVIKSLSLQLQLLTIPEPIEKEPDPYYCEKGCEIPYIEAEISPGTPHCLIHGLPFIYFAKQKSAKEMFKELGYELLLEESDDVIYKNGFKTIRIDCHIGVEYPQIEMLYRNGKRYTELNFIKLEKIIEAARQQLKEFEDAKQKNI